MRDPSSILIDICQKNKFMKSIKISTPQTRFYFLYVGKHNQNIYRFVVVYYKLHFTCIIRIHYCRLLLIKKKPQHKHKKRLYTRIDFYWLIKFNDYIILYVKY